MSKSPFLEYLQSGRTLVLDGATGTNLAARGLPRGLTGETWVLEKPEEILRLHGDFIAAGADIILTCTFNATAMWLEDATDGGKAAQVTRRAVELARQAAAGSRTLVAGSLGPIGQLIKPLGPLEEADAERAYAALGRALGDAGVDLLLVETQFDLTEASAAVRGVRASSTLPLVGSFSFDRGTRSMMGVKPAQAAAALESLGVDVVGINCGRSLEENLQALTELRAATSMPVWFKPNAGLPHLVDGQAAYDVTPEAMGAEAPKWVAAGAQMVGGCCGTTPAHLAAIAAAVK